MNMTPGELVIALLINLIITFIGYCGVPLLLRLINGKYEYEKGRKIILINCIIVCLIFMIIKVSQGSEARSTAVFLYYYINKAILLKKQTDIEKETEDSKEEKEINDKKEIKEEKNTKNTENIKDTEVEKVETKTTNKNKTIECEQHKLNNNILFYVIIGTLCLIIVAFIGHILNANSKMEELENENKRLSSNISSLEFENTILEDKNKRICTERDELKEKVDFFDEHVVFVIEGYGKYYYTYDQLEIVTRGVDKFSYYIYSDVNARENGYKAWKK